MTHISFEFFPPKTDEQRTQLDRTASKLRIHGPEYVSCTFGAGGSTLSYTSETVRRLRVAWIDRRIASVQFDCVVTEAELRSAPERLQLYQQTLQALRLKRQEVLRS